MLKKLTFVQFLILILIPILFYTSSLKFYFSQDDFIHLYSSHAANLSQFLNFFNPSAQFPDIFFYRPIGTQVYFFINQTLFGLNPTVFRIEILLFQSLNTILFYFLIRSLWKDSRIAFLSALFYGVSANHFLSIFYISAFQEVIRMTFVLGSLIAFIQYLNSYKLYLLLISCGLFIFALLSKETSVVLPVLIFGTAYLIKFSDFSHSFEMTGIKKAIYVTIPYFILLGGYLGIRFVGFQQIFGKGEYEYSFKIINLFQNLKWYLIWTLGLPEILSNYPSLKPQGLLQFTNDYSLSLPLLIVSLLFVVCLFFLIFKLKNFPKEMVLYGGFIFLVGLLPVLPLVGHRYPQYLDICMIGYLPIISFYIVKGFKYRVLAIIAILSFLIIQVLSIRLSEETHWTTHRSIVAKFYYDQFKNKNINLDDTKLILVGDDYQLKEVSVALGKSYAFWDWYPDLKTPVQYLNKEDLGKVQPNEVIGELTVY